MSSHRITHAVERIERALARIETQAALAGHARRDPGVPSVLVEQHDALRERVDHALADLDTLIRELEG